MKDWNFTEEESQDGNDMICVFFGGTIEPSFGGEELYRFDAPNTNALIMKCPPFGILHRTFQGQRIMRFHEDYNHLMAIIKECWKKTQEDETLKDAFQEITTCLTDFWHVGGTCLMAHRAVLEFIELYNKKPEK